jgi:hypothetical protein
MKIATVFSAIALVLLFLVQPLAAQGNLPQSREATFVEMVGGTEVLVKAKGIGGESGLFGFKEDESKKLAEADARKSAVYLVLYGGAGLDGVLKSDEDKKKFSPIQNEFFAESNVQKYIAWEASGLDSRVKMAGVKHLSTTSSSEGSSHLCRR